MPPKANANRRKQRLHSPRLEPPSELEQPQINWHRLLPVWLLLLSLEDQQCWIIQLRMLLDMSWDDQLWWLRQQSPITRALWIEQLPWLHKYWIDQNPWVFMQLSNQSLLDIMHWVVYLPTLPWHTRKKNQCQIPWMSGLGEIIVFGCKLSSLYQKSAQILLLLSEAEDDKSIAKEIWYLIVLMDDVIKSDCQDVCDDWCKLRRSSNTLERIRQAESLYKFKVKNLTIGIISILNEFDTLADALEKIKSQFAPEKVKDLKTHQVVVASRSV